MSYIALCLFMLAGTLSARGTNDPQIHPADEDIPLIATHYGEEPVILVHGFAGWGRDDIPGFYYWGGFRDLEGELARVGFDVYSAAIGPFSGNWDRACELYAYINGGEVDYGEAHSTEHGHERYGTFYPGIYPEWSSTDRINIIAHSMGGTTARLLAHLLKNGHAAERALSGSDCSPLFAGGEQRIKSITTLSTPHNGTSIVNDEAIIDAIMRAAIAAVATVVENELFLDFDLRMGHWGIRRIEGEPLRRYFSRLRDHEVWSATQLDFSMYDVSVDGASAFNRRVPAEPDVFYFSWSNEATSSGPLRGYRIPEMSVLAAFVPSCVYIGSMSERDLVSTGISWRENDGVVNTSSMIGPRLGSTDVIVGFDGTPEPGIWNYMGVIPSADHADVLGIPSWDISSSTGFDSIFELYMYMCELVLGL